ncbi:MAG: NTP transferase domain-containing protein [bacterium]|nr:NTP transferase domain-containing protein [bacterium]
MRTAILITARLKSTRLEQKALKTILGRSMICHQIDRLKLAAKPERIILCTSPLQQDDPLVEIAVNEGIDYFRGHPDDVLLRLTNAAEYYHLDNVVNVTADNPFVDPVYIDRLLDFLQESQYDFAMTEGLPLGTFGWALSYPAMRRACEIKAETDTEVWGPYFTQTGLFHWGILLADASDSWPELRLTVDTPEDFDLVNRIFQELGVTGQIFSLRSIISLCKNRPDWVAINSSIKQKKPVPIKLKQEVQRLLAFDGGKNLGENS